jgi:hypothetical protein
VRRAVVAWVVVVVFAFGAATAAVVALNATAFGAAGFVRVYLEAVSRGDAVGALSMPGVTVDAAVRDEFLADDALAGPTSVREITTGPGDAGTEVVTVAWSRGETDAVSTFTVERTGSRVGLFPDWAFAVSPVATLRLTVEHDPRFDLNGVPSAEGSADYAVLVPGVYRVDHHSTYLEAAAVDVVADRPASELGTTLDVQPAAAFTDALTVRIHEDLDACAAQDVLFPTGCPLGHTIANRVASAPVWSIVEYPQIAIEPGPDFGTWLVRDAELVSHLTVDIQSLFDGSITTFDEDLPVSATYRVTIGADDTTLRVEAL